MLKTILLGAGMLLFLLFLSRRKASIEEQPAIKLSEADAERLPSPTDVSLRHFERSPALSRRGAAALDRT